MLRGSGSIIFCVYSCCLFYLLNGFNILLSNDPSLKLIIYEKRTCRYNKRTGSQLEEKKTEPEKSIRVEETTAINEATLQFSTPSLEPPIEPTSTTPPPERRSS